ncbi:MAG: putative histidine kinase [candidate division CPR2 bacterium GW2011_GWC1_41_48]|uniref:Putative histidine kinase n=1 Tax=candidate division CPR2 bacterium GW2011_GWC1_41_48 TaxID=1618344 RepID=A0A0G0YIR3_UNCC2|nr:MAG: putative histidine kinase [candidate division CPR2 bacterium GW2011_GWC2_39_35]KKR27568.1 MAG: putative histidine kinase [candidate division CPR2 bacterium GW2011_GWD2_39_7]KKR29589.1 MAG: putative histidine kinase [candidate division CPR2 bacterium GW2011_GWD1_39_7]KKS09446.1 MAG: putative histidine kinase [candidate division CPR2 bacterium GW2011_GWC1_41_48]OGB71518.1 MAG: hypothetical protein A2Y26_01605 [candidate division CPR2 bacterium GWD2_39_7]
MDIKKKVTQTIFNVAHVKGKLGLSDILANLDIEVSRQYITSILKDLVQKGELIRSGGGRFTEYALPRDADLLRNRTHIRLKNVNLQEHEILDRIQKQTPFLGKLTENVLSIFTFAFSEMLNNAIEHSLSSEIDIEVIKENNNLKFTISDSGIGVFRNIMKKRGLKSELEAIQDLLKGKTTTAPQAHSGEGIFFTSKAADIFVLDSFEYRLRIDNLINDVFVEDIKPAKKGTRVTFTISVESGKHLSDVFAKYQTDSEEMAFDKTEIRIKLYAMGTIYVSRSQARRVTVNLSKFKVIILDFDKVPTIGQAFADEIFRVFQSKHPDIVIKPINMNETVKFMIDRVEKP